MATLLSFVFLTQQQPSKNTTKDNNPFAVQYIFCLRFTVAIDGMPADGKQQMNA